MAVSWCGDPGGYYVIKRRDAKIWCFRGSGWCGQLVEGRLKVSGRWQRYERNNQVVETDKNGFVKFLPVILLFCRKEKNQKSPKDMCYLHHIFISVIFLTKDISTEFLNHISKIAPHLETAHPRARRTQDGDTSCTEITQAIHHASKDSPRYIYAWERHRWSSATDERLQFNLVRS